LICELLKTISKLGPEDYYTFNETEVVKSNFRNELEKILAENFKLNCDEVEDNSNSTYNEQKNRDLIRA
jgi:hypothetical protein